MTTPPKGPTMFDAEDYDPTPSPHRDMSDAEQKAIDNECNEWAARKFQENPLAPFAVPHPRPGSPLKTTETDDRIFRIEDENEDSHNVTVTAKSARAALVQVTGRNDWYPSPGQEWTGMEVVEIFADGSELAERFDHPAE